MLNFLKKYPMSILLAIIALNLFSIAGSLKSEAELNEMKIICLQKDFYTAEQLEKKLGKYIYSCNVLRRAI